MAARGFAWLEIWMLRLMQLVLTAKRNRIIRRHIPIRARRIADFGCGHFPNRHANVLVDLTATEDVQRGGLRVDRGNGERTFHDLDLNAFPYPFADGHFDYLICSHVLEHLEDPVRTCAEFARIAKAGYIEVPFGAVDIFIRNNDIIHKWLCALDPGTGTVLFADRRRSLEAFPPPGINQCFRFLLQFQNLARTWNGDLPARYIPVGNPHH